MVYIIETIILYCVLFFPDLSINFLSGEALEKASNSMFIFSAEGELLRIFSYNIPIIALIWFILYGKRQLIAHNGNLNFNLAAGYVRRNLPRKKDFLTALISFGLVFLAAILLSLISLLLPEVPEIEFPKITLSAISVLIVVVSSLSTGYMEEGFFRLYLFKRMEKAGVKSGSIVILSTALFAACHFYEGLLGVLNAAFCGIILSMTYKKTRSYHGAAIAHAAWDILVWLANV